MTPVEPPEALAAARAAWIDAVNAGDLDAYTDLVTEGILWFAPGPLVIEGRTAFRHWLAPFLERYAYGFSIETSGVQVAERWAIEEGAFRSELTDRSSGETFVHEGRMVVFWRRGDDGAWRIDRYADMTDPA